MFSVEYLWALVFFVATASLAGTVMVLLGRIKALTGYLEIEHRNVAKGIQDSRSLLFTKNTWESAYKTLAETYIESLTILEKVVYLAEGEYVPKRTLVQLLELLGRKATHGATTEGGSIYRHGDDGVGSESEQAAVNRDGGLEEREAAKPDGDLGR